MRTIRPVAEEREAPRPRRDGAQPVTTAIRPKASAIATTGRPTAGSNAIGFATATGRSPAPAATSWCQMGRTHRSLEPVRGLPLGSQERRRIARVANSKHNSRVQEATSLPGSARFPPSCRHCVAHAEAMRRSHGVLAMRAWISSNCRMFRATDRPARGCKKIGTAGGFLPAACSLHCNEERDDDLS